MPTKKIADLPNPKKCNDPEHEPPTMAYFSPGVYEHTCPKGGAVKRFTVQHPEFHYDDTNPDYIKGTEDGI
jgi:hypothetical protein